MHEVCFVFVEQITGETVGEVRPVADMHQRKAEMARHSDCFIALPGLSLSLSLSLSLCVLFSLFLSTYDGIIYIFNCVLHNQVAMEHWRSYWKSSHGPSLESMTSL